MLAVRFRWGAPDRRRSPPPRRSGRWSTNRHLRLPAQRADRTLGLRSGGHRAELGALRHRSRRRRSLWWEARRSRRTGRSCLEPARGRWPSCHQPPCLPRSCRLRSDPLHRQTPAGKPPEPRHRRPGHARRAPQRRWRRFGSPCRSRRQRAFQHLRRWSSGPTDLRRLHPERGACPMWLSSGRVPGPTAPPPGTRRRMPRNPGFRRSARPAAQKRCRLLRGWQRLWPGLRPNRQARSDGGLI